MYIRKGKTYIMLNKKLAISPSRCYVAQCYKMNFDGFYFRSFSLPKELENNGEVALHYYMGKLDAVGCVENVFPVENYNDIKVKDSDFLV
jgi:hypothetical protein